MSFGLHFYKVFTSLCRLFQDNVGPFFFYLIDLQFSSLSSSPLLLCLVGDCGGVVGGLDEEVLITRCLQTLSNTERSVDSGVWRGQEGSIFRTPWRLNREPLGNNLKKKRIWVIFLQRQLWRNTTKSILFLSMYMSIWNS